MSMTLITVSFFGIMDSVAIAAKLNTSAERCRIYIHDIHDILAGFEPTVFR